MNILYVSCLEGRPWAGPTYSVPKQIQAQSKYDNVMWLNIYDRSVEQWEDEISWRSLPYYHSIEEYKSDKISDLPEPFNHPDLIVFEQFYTFFKSSFIKQAFAFPYIIIPRGELTHTAQCKKRLKKAIANLLYFKRFAKKAVAIQYLTQEELEASGTRWNNSSLILPNGTELYDFDKTFSKEGFQGAFIGRIEPYQKGLDILIEACITYKEQLKTSGFHVTIYGPDRVGKLNTLKKQVESNSIEDLVTFGDGLYGEEKSVVLKRADFFILTSRFEGHPTALIEALAYGVPCVVTKGSNMKDKIESFDAGWTAEDSAESVGQALLKMIQEKQSLSKKSANARLLASSYSWDSIAKTASDQYKKIII